MREIPKPERGEFAPYTTMYINLLPNDGLVLQHLADNLQLVKDFAYLLPSEKLITPHAPDEWTVQEILVHIMDDERIYVYRALRFARGDTTELAGFEQDDYVPPSKANDRTLADIFDEYAAIRAATISFFKYVPQEALPLIGMREGVPMSVRAAAYHIAGHELHHLNSMRKNYG